MCRQVQLNRLVDAVVAMDVDAWTAEDGIFTAQVKGHKVVLPYGYCGVLDLAVDGYYLKADAVGQYNEDRLHVYRIKLQIAQTAKVDDAVDNILRDFDPESAQKGTP